MLSKCIRNTVVGSFIFRVLIKSRKCSLRKESHSKNWAPMLTVLPLSHFLSSVLNSQVLFSEGDCRCWDHVNDLQQMLWMMHEPCGGFTKMSLKIQINLKRVKELWKGILSCMGPAGAPCPIQVATPLLYHAPCYSKEFAEGSTIAWNWHFLEAHTHPSLDTWTPGSTGATAAGEEIWKNLEVEWACILIMFSSWN